MHLIEICRGDFPRLGGEVDVVRVMNLCQVVEGPRLLGIGQPVCSTVVCNRDESLFDVDVRRSVLAHRPELHQMTLRLELLSREPRSLMR